MKANQNINITNRLIPYEKYITEITYYTRSGKNYSQYYFQINHNLLHRVNGPAVIFSTLSNKDNEWWINGKQLNTKEIETWIKNNNINLKTKQHQVLFMLRFG